MSHAWRPLDVISLPEIVLLDNLSHQTHASTLGIALDAWRGAIAVSHIRPPLSACDLSYKK